MSKLDSLHMVADSLQQAHVADSLQQIHVADSLRQVFVADSLHRVYVADSLATARLVAERTIFGDEASLAVATRRVAQIAEGGVESLSSNMTFLILAVVFLLTYLLWLPHILRNGSIRWSQFKRHRDTRGDVGGNVLGRQRMGVLFVAWSLFMVLFPMIVVRAVAQFYPVELDFSGSMWISWAVVAVMCMAIYGWAMLSVGGYLSLNVEFVEKILYAKRQFMVLCSLFASPLFIISSLANYNQGEWVMQMALLVGVIFVLIYLRQSFLLFVRQNFSILHWFLYLCGVEILPLTFVWAITTRYLVI
ncbi:MAG: DUF4271 domain-containing protein [Rikenellaceae bacterium]